MNCVAGSRVTFYTLASGKHAAGSDRTQLAVIGLSWPDARGGVLTKQFKYYGNWKGDPVMDQVLKHAKLVLWKFEGVQSVVSQNNDYSWRFKIRDFLAVCSFEMQFGPQTNRAWNDISPCCGVTLPKLELEFWKYFIWTFQVQYLATDG